MSQQTNWIHHHILGTLRYCSRFLKSLQSDFVFSTSCRVPLSYLLDFTSLPSCLIFCFGLCTLLPSWFCSVFPGLATTDSPFREFLCSAPQEALLLSLLMLLLPLASGITIQFGDSSSGMVAWEGVRRALGGWDHPVHGEPLLWNCQRGTWCVPTISLRHSLVGGTKALVYFTSIEIAPVSTQSCICSRLVPYQLGSTGFANALACVCLGWRIAHAELWHLYALF